MYWCKRALISIAILSVFFVNGFCADENENLKILKALELVKQSKYDEASDIYKKLYDSTNGLAYLKEAIKLAYKNDKKFSKLLQVGEKYLNQDSEFLRLKSMQFLRKGDIKNAKIVVLRLLQNEKNERNYKILANLYLVEKNNKKAYENFKKAYEYNHSKENLLSMSQTAGDKEEFIRYLEQNKSENGCIDWLCEVLSDEYLSTHKYTKMYDLNIALYKSKKEKEYLDKALVALIYLKDTVAIKNLFENFMLYSPIQMVDVFSSLEDYKSAYDISFLQYKKTKDKKFQAMMGVFKYEMYGENIDNKNLKDVLSDLDSSVLIVNDAIYYNYYGYLLIDFDIDVEKGIKMVKMALEKEPDSAYYLDSLAWGYYKLNQCKKAQDAMYKAVIHEEFKNSSVANEHYEKIKECGKLNKSRSH